jgi:hypothetical protein
LVESCSREEVVSKACLASLKVATEVEKASGKEMQVVIVGD